MAGESNGHDGTVQDPFDARFGLRGAPRRTRALRRLGQLFLVGASEASAAHNRFEHCGEILVSMSAGFGGAETL
jgi:hypothetical protein